MHKGFLSLHLRPSNVELFRKWILFVENSMIFNFADDKVLSATAAITPELTTVPELEIVWVFSSSILQNENELSKMRKNELSDLLHDFNPTYDIWLEKTDKTTMSVGRLKTLCNWNIQKVPYLKPAFMKALFTPKVTERHVFKNIRGT